MVIEGVSGGRHGQGAGDGAEQSPAAQLMQQNARLVSITLEVPLPNPPHSSPVAAPGRLRSRRLHLWPASCKGLFGRGGSAARHLVCVRWW